MKCSSCKVHVSNPVIDLYSKLDTSSHDSNLSDSDVLEWVETYINKVDYGDNTCQTTKKRITKEKNFVNILRIWKTIAVRYNITYFLTYGSLLGAVRNSNFLPLDRDIDVMVDITYYDVLSSIDNRRNFDPRHVAGFHVILQNDLKMYSSSRKRRRQNCMGKVQLIQYILINKAIKR